MDGYLIVNLADMVNEIGEDACRRRLSDFSCAMNKDVELYLKRSAIVFAQQGIASTHLIYTSYKGEPVIAGYFTISIKFMRVYINKIGKTLGKRVKKFAMEVIDGKAVVPALLIGQLGKNYTNNYDKLISGDILLKLAENKAREAQHIAGGRFIYLECEDHQRLIQFYSDNGFVNFGERELEADEKDLFTSKKLVQMMKYLKQ